MALEILAKTSEEFTQLEREGEEKPFQCTVNECGRIFTSKRNLVDHTRGHHQGVKPHVCHYPGCGKSFLRPAHLQIHIRIHTGEKPFVCEYEGCGKRWNQKSALKQHMRSHTGEKPFACTLEGCNKRFSTSSSCKRHVLTHSKHQLAEKVAPARKRKMSIDEGDEIPSPQPSPKRFASDSEDDHPVTVRNSFSFEYQSNFEFRPNNPPSPKMAVHFLIN